jgi:hypothetical protein
MSARRYSFEKFEIFTNMDNTIPPKLTDPPPDYRQAGNKQYLWMSSINREL